MAFTKEQLVNIFIGCNRLKKFVFNSDICCDTPWDDQLIGNMRKYCPNLEYLDLCPGNYQTTDFSLNIISTFPNLKYLKIVEFNGITQQGISKLLSKLDSLNQCIIEDCCDIDQYLLTNLFYNLHQGKYIISCIN